MFEESSRVRHLIEGGDDRYRSPERIRGMRVTIQDGTDDGSDHGGL